LRVKIPDSIKAFTGAFSRQILYCVSFLGRVKFSLSGMGISDQKLGKCL
jgi:hypothetical protein